MKAKKAAVWMENHVSCFSSQGVSLCSSSQKISSGTLRKLVKASWSSTLHQMVIVPQVCSPQDPLSDPKSSWGSPPPPSSLLGLLGKVKVKFRIIFLQLHEYLGSMK